ncbi:hypothetical protein GGI43DRAFT_145874 [Trichoderma evansii]
MPCARLACLLHHTHSRSQAQSTTTSPIIYMLRALGPRPSQVLVRSAFARTHALSPYKFAPLPSPRPGTPARQADAGSDKLQSIVRLVDPHWPAPLPSPFWISNTRGTTEAQLRLQDPPPSCALRLLTPPAPAPALLLRCARSGV